MSPNYNENFKIFTYTFSKDFKIKGQSVQAVSSRSQDRLTSENKIGKNHFIEIFEADSMKFEIIFVISFTQKPIFPY